MEFRLAYRHVLPGLLLSGFMLAVAGCQSGDSGSVLGSATGTTTDSAAKPAEEKVKESDLRGYCPRVTLRDGTAFFNSYAKGGQDDPAKLLYQASITNVTRSCKRSDGMVNITVAVAGRVVPGPAGAPGTITMPIRIAVVQGETVLYSQLHKHQVAVGDASAATQFVFNDPNISLPEPSQRDIQIFAGYDEGPPAKKTASAE
jgi:hypothetical protein